MERRTKRARRGQEGARDDVRWAVVKEEALMVGWSARLGLGVGSLSNPLADTVHCRSFGGPDSGISSQIVAQVGAGYSFLLVMGGGIWQPPWTPRRFSVSVSASATVYPMSY